MTFNKFIDYMYLNSCHEKIEFTSEISIKSVSSLDTLVCKTKKQSMHQTDGLNARHTTFYHLAQPILTENMHIFSTKMYLCAKDEESNYMYMGTS